MRDPNLSNYHILSHRCSIIGFDAMSYWKENLSKALSYLLGWYGWSWLHLTKMVENHELDKTARLFDLNSRIWLCNYNFHSYADWGVNAWLNLSPNWPRIKKFPGLLSEKKMWQIIEWLVGKVTGKLILPDNISLFTLTTTRSQGPQVEYQVHFIQLRVISSKWEVSILLLNTKLYHLQHIQFIPSML